MTADLIKALQQEPIDVLVNNAGRSIRRRIADSIDRLHDYQRTTRLNCFAPVQLSLGVLPEMITRNSGQIVNVCTWGLLANTFPRFVAYAASKNALAIFGRSLNAENPASGIRATTVNFPLVKIGIAPTKQYDDIAAAHRGRGWTVDSTRHHHRPTSITPAALRLTLAIVDYLAPSVSDRVIASLTCVAAIEAVCVAILADIHYSAGFICLGDGTKWVSFGPGIYTTGMIRTSVMHWTTLTSTTVASGSTDVWSSSQMVNVRWWQDRYDGTNINFSFSHNGVDWTPSYYESYRCMADRGRCLASVGQRPRSEPPPWEVGVPGGRLLTALCEPCVTEVPRGAARCTKSPP